MSHQLPRMWTSTTKTGELWHNPSGGRSSYAILASLATVGVMCLLFATTTDAEATAKLSGTCYRVDATSYYCYMYTYICEKHFFPWAPLAKPLTTSAQKGRLESVVEVWARSEHCSSRGVLSKFLSGGSGWDDFPGFSVWGLPGILQVRAGKIWFVVSLSHKHTAQDIHHS